MTTDEVGRGDRVMDVRRCRAGVLVTHGRGGVGDLAQAQTLAERGLRGVVRHDECLLRGFGVHGTAAEVVHAPCGLRLMVAFESAGVIRHGRRQGDSCAVAVGEP